MSDFLQRLAARALRDAPTTARQRNVPPSDERVEDDALVSETALDRSMIDSRPQPQRVSADVRRVHVEPNERSPVAPLTNTQRRPLADLGRASIREPSLGRPEPGPAADPVPTAPAVLPNHVSPASPRPARARTPGDTREVARPAVPVALEPRRRETRIEPAGSRTAAMHAPKADQLGGRDSRYREPASTSTVHVTIGRLEVRAVSPPPASTLRPTPATPRVTLADYLAQRRR